MGLGRLTLLLAFCLSALSSFGQKINLAPSAHIQLSFSQEMYSPDDTAYFVVRYLNDDLTPVDGSNFLTISTYDSEGEGVGQDKIKVINGVGAGYICFPEVSAAGVFKVIAYSNITGSRVCKRSIPVVKNNNLLVEKTITLHPEGGGLVDGFNNRIAIHGIQPNQVIEITNDSDSVLVETKLNAFGWGAVDLKLEAETKYFVSYKGDQSKISLSDLFTKGFAVRMDGLNSDAKQINISAANKMDALGCVLLVTSNNKVLFQSSFNYKSGEQLIRVIPKSILAQGLHQLYVIGANGAKLGYREFYLPKENPVSVNLSESKLKYQTRELVELAMSLADESGNAIKGSGSISVINQSVLDLDRSNSGSGHFGLLDMMGDVATADINDYLISQRANFVDEDLSLGNVSSEFLKSGKAISKTTGKPLPEGAKILFYFHKSQQLALIKLNEGAEFGFKDVSNVHGSDDIFYIAEDFYGFEIEDVHIEWYPNRVVHLSTDDVKSNSGDESKYATFNRNRKLINQSFAVFEDYEKYSGDEVAAIDRFELKYIEADNVFKMSNFLSFPTMKETITEVVKPLSVTRNSKLNVIRINNLDAATPTSSPVYIIDGVATKDTDYLLSMNPADLKEIRVFRDRINLKKFGFLGRNGLIWVTTAAGNGAPPVDPNGRFVAPQKPTAFSPSRVDHPSPTFESTVYWNPNMVIDGNSALRFTTSDDLGEYLIRIDGITDDGRVFSTERVIEVGMQQGSEEK